MKQSHKRVLATLISGAAAGLGAEYADIGVTSADPALSSIIGALIGWLSVRLKGPSHAPAGNIK